MDFKLVSEYKPTGDQPEAIAQLVDALRSGCKHNTLLGVTGSGKTFTMANVIAALNKPTLIMSHNKTLAAQLYGEFKNFFPENAVEYFVSYYDYYQPEAYIPSTDTFIEKDLSINDEIEKMRLSTSSALLSGRNDIIVVSSVSCIYGIGNPEDFHATSVELRLGDVISRNKLLYGLVDALYTRSEADFKPGTFRVNGDTVDIYVAYGDKCYRVIFFDNEIEMICSIDPHTGHTLMERTIIICNTSNMPVAAREASVYTGMTIGEYYRSMGLKVLVMADSTSRWAQALREMSNRLEELPGQDAFPMDLSAIISNFYSRAGLVKLNNGQTGSVTFLGTVSPAGGNLKEPVTESTKKAARCFYALSQGRADSKRYPAIDPLESYSKYLEYPEIREYLDEHIEKDWVDLVYAGKTLVQRGKEANDQINILGDDGVPVEYHERFWKSELLDFVILQQDAFDDIDANCPLERQKMMYKMVLDICRKDFAFADFEECSQFFKGLINLFRQMNYSEWQSEKFEGYRKQIEEYVSEKIK